LTKCARGTHRGIREREAGGAGKKKANDQKNIPITDGANLSKGGGGSTSNIRRAPFNCPELFRQRQKLPQMGAPPLRVGRKTQKRTYRKVREQKL